MGILQAQEARKVELQKLAGRIDGVYWAASEALRELSQTLRHYAGQRDAGDEEDWSGRGTGNNQRPATGELAVTPGNGERKRTRRRGTTGRAPRNASPDPAGGNGSGEG